MNYMKALAKKIRARLWQKVVHGSRLGMEVSVLRNGERTKVLTLALVPSPGGWFTSWEAHPAGGSIAIGPHDVLVIRPPKDSTIFLHRFEVSRRV